MFERGLFGLQTPHYNMVKIIIISKDEFIIFVCMLMNLVYSNKINNIGREFAALTYVSMRRVRSGIISGLHKTTH